jgi:hypothetical protein
MLPHEILWWLAAWLCISLLVSLLIGKLIRGPKYVRSRLWLVPRTAGRWPSCDPVGRPAKRPGSAVQRLQPPDAHHRDALPRLVTDALGVVRNLPGAFAGAALHPPVVPARAVPNLQDGPEESGIARVTVLALTRMAEGERVIGVEPNTGGITVGTSIKGWPPPPTRSRLHKHPPNPGRNRPKRCRCGSGARRPSGVAADQWRGCTWARAAHDQLLAPVTPKPFPSVPDLNPRTGLSKLSQHLFREDLANR